MSKLRLRSRIKLFASLFDGTATKVRKDGLAMYVDLSTTGLALLGSFDPSAEQVIVQNTTDSSFALLTITQLLTAAQTTQVKTTAGDVNVATTDGLIVVNKTVGGATNVNLPLASTKVGPVKVVDFKGDAATNNITITVAGADVLNGSSTTYVIDSNNGSFVFNPITGTGYAV